VLKQENQGRFVAVEDHRSKISANISVLAILPKGRDGAIRKFTLNFCLVFSFGNIFCFFG
jgi:hypothetical protein